MLTDLMKIMLVEDDPQDRDSFRVATSRIPYFAIVYETGSEQEALDFLLTHTVDVIILDIDLEEGDGVSFLDSLAEQKIDKPYIAVVTNNSSAITLGYVRDHGADYIYRKDNRMYTPEKVLGVIEKTFPYRKVVLHQQNMEREDEYCREKDDYFKREYIENALLDMGFKRELIGFTYITDAVMILMDYSGITPRLTSEVYPEIARKRNTSKESVERSIRHAIESTFKRTSKPKLRHFYPYRYDQTKGRPSNGEFLLRFARQMRV